MSERVHGVRAAIFFQPQVLSRERICAGVVLRLDDGRVAGRVAIQAAEAAHAFGIAGVEIHAIAHHLCNSLVQHLNEGGDFSDWVAPFENASIDKLGRVEGANLSNLLESQTQQNSVIFTLLSGYEIPAAKAGDGIVKQVKRVIQNSKASHLAARFHRELPVKRDALPLRVEFLGANYACYFLQISQSARGIEESARRAHGKLFELQNVKAHFKGPQRKDIFDEQPTKFELLVVGDRKSPLQNAAWLQIESLADSNNLRARLLGTPAEAASEVTRLERAA